jgi:NAD(P)-dependent dehydrogenase (short-subunit alcohol dehydrogenase family)
VRDLARDYAVIALVNRQRLDQSLATLPHVREVQADLTAPGWENAAATVVGAGTLYGVVHAAWPGVPHGGLLQASDQVIRRQTEFGTTQMIQLAQFLFSRVGAAGGRVVALGSIFGHQRPSLSLAAYSLGKAALETTVRLLAPELARKQVTINAICPSFVPLGMNKQVTERQLMLESARVPLGRLCMPEDVTGAIRYLFSPAAAFISGQVLGLTGAQL